MVLASVDQAVDKVISELRRAGMFRNSVVLLTTDNGGGPWYSNTPLRGTKETLFEGGIRAASFLLSPLLQVRSSHHTRVLQFINIFSILGPLSSVLACEKYF